MFMALDRRHNKNWAALIALPLAAFMAGKMLGDRMSNRG